MKLIDVELPFFAPVWVRVVTVAVCVGWALFEIVRGAPVWGALFMALGAYLVWQFTKIDYATLVADAEQRENEDG